MSTAYHAKYIVYELTKQCAANSVEKIAATLADAQVDLNPHQIEAALFAFRSPLSRGAILADEVGLGKTITRFIPYSAETAILVPWRVPDIYGGGQEVHAADLNSAKALTRFDS